MESFIQVNGLAIRSMGLACGFLQKEIVTWVSGRRESWMAKEFTNAKVGRDMKAASRTSSNMDGENRSFPMEIPMKELTVKACLTEKVSIAGKT